MPGGRTAVAVNSSPERSLFTRIGTVIGEHVPAKAEQLNRYLQSGPASDWECFFGAPDLRKLRFTARRGRFRSPHSMTISAASRPGRISGQEYVKLSAALRRAVREDVRLSFPDRGNSKPFVVKMELLIGSGTTKVRKVAGLRPDEAQVGGRGYIRKQAGNLRCVHEAAAVTGESPFWDTRSQALFSVNIPAKKIHRFDPATGRKAVWQTPEEVGCVATHAAGGLIVALRKGFHHFSIETETFTPIFIASDEPPSNRFNDGRTDRRGRFGVAHGRWRKGSERLALSSRPGWQMRAPG